MPAKKPDKQPKMAAKNPQEQNLLALFDMLVCPVSKTPLTYDSDRQELISKQAGLAYPVRDGIPIMLPEEARKISD